MKRHAIVLLGVTLVVVLVEVVAGRVLVARDPITGFFGFQITTIAAAIGLLAARLVSYLVIPGWALYVGVMALVARFAKKP